MNSPNGNTRPRHGRTTRWHAIMVPALAACCLIVGVSTDARANMPPPKPKPQMNMQMKLTVPDTVRAGDTVVATLDFMLLSPVQFPERGEHGRALVTILYRPGAANVIPLPPFVGWEDTLGVGDRHTIQHRFETSTPGWLFFSAEVAGGIPYIDSPSGHRWGSLRFGNGIEDSTRVVGEDVSKKTESADQYQEFDRLLPPPGGVLSPRRVGEPANVGKLASPRPVEPASGGIHWNVNWVFAKSAAGGFIHDTAQHSLIGLPRGSHVVFQIVGPRSGTAPKISAETARGAQTIVYRTPPIRVEYIAPADSGVTDTLILRDQEDSTLLLIPIRTTADSTARILDEPKPGLQIK